jgi:hypothetical protein
MPTLQIPAIQGRLIVLAILLLGLAACRQAAGGVPIEETDDNKSAADVVLTLSPTTEERLLMGPFEWTIQLADGAGTPIEGATIAIRGDMNHAGMVPVEAVAAEAGEGLYRADFEWTMAGEWIVTVNASLPDGQMKTETLTYNVFVR